MPDNQLKIIFEDERIIVVEKPAGMLTMSTGKAGETTAYSILYDYVNNTSRRAQQRLYIVHRLDRDTSGLLLFAKDLETKEILQENWDKLVQERKYLAILEGTIQDKDGWIECWLYENPKSMKVHCYEFMNGDKPEFPPRKDWQFAASHCHATMIGNYEGKTYTFVEFSLETGRKNQIRAQAQWIGHPIAGDKKYGAKSNPISRLALHAQGLSIIHPWSGKSMKFTSALPKSFRKIKKSSII